MTNLTKSMLCLGLAAGFGFSAQAFELVSPVEGEVYEVAALKSITLKWSSDIMEYPDGQVIVYDSSNKQVSTGQGDFDWDDYSAYTVTFSPAVTEAGTYKVVVPANMAPDNDNIEYTLTYKVVGSNAPAAMPTAIEPEPGSEIVQDTYTWLRQVRLDFANEVALTQVNEALITITNQNGDLIPYTVGGWYLEDDPMLQYAQNPFVTFNFNEDGDMPSGTYTFTAKPGAFTSPNGVNMEEITATYTYTKTKAERDETPLVIEKALLGHVTSPAAGQFVWNGTDAVEFDGKLEMAELIGTNNAAEGTGFLLTLNHGEKSEYLTWQLIDTNKRTVITTGEGRKQEDNTFLIGIASSKRLYKGTTYDIEIRTYDNIQNKVEFGDGAHIEIEGITEPYNYSPAQFVTVVPSSGSDLYSLKDNKATVLFSQPVRATATCSIGMGAGTFTLQTESATGKDYDNVWYVYISDNVMLEYPNVEIDVVAYDEEGRIVAQKDDDAELEENSTNKFNYHLMLCQPRIMLGQTNSHLPKIDTFTAYSSKNNGINTSWLDYPYVVNAKGETVATLNQQYYYDEYNWVDSPYKPLRWTGVPGDFESDPLELEFQMVPEITEKGKYTLVFPKDCFNFGTQFDGETSIGQEFDFYVVDFFPVTYTVDSSTIELSPVELGKSAVLNLTPAENWKLASLTINDLDVTNEVTDGKYTAPAATGAIDFKAEFTYDGAVSIPTGADEIVTDLELRGWTENGDLYVAGLKPGQVVKVFTLNGAQMLSAVVDNEHDTLQLDVPAGTYIVTVADGDKQVALKLINK